MCCKTVLKLLRMKTIYSLPTPQMLRVIIMASVVLVLYMVCFMTRDAVLKSVYRRDYVTLERYQSLLEELENISKSVLTVESQSKFLDNELKSLKQKAEKLMKKQHEFNVAQKADCVFVQCSPTSTVIETQKGTNKFMNALQKNPHTTRK